MRLGCHQINNQAWERPLPLPENQRKCSPKSLRTKPLPPLNGRTTEVTLGLHFRWVDGWPESYILKWLDTRPVAFAPPRASPDHFEGQLWPEFSHLRRWSSRAS